MSERCEACDRVECGVGIYPIPTGKDLNRSHCIPIDWRARALAAEAALAEIANDWKESGPGLPPRCRWCGVVDRSDDYSAPHPDACPVTVARRALEVSRG